MTTFEFSLTANDSTASNGYVALSGLCFRCGDYPDKEFSLTEDEADEAIAAFTQPVNMNDCHNKKSIVSGKWGQITGLVRKGAEIFATFSIPQWLHKIYQEEKAPLKVSMEWSHSPKRLFAGAWEIEPRIHDAHVAVFSANEAEPEPTDKKPDDKPPTQHPTPNTQHPSPANKRGFSFDRAEPPKRTTMYEKFKQDYLKDCEEGNKSPDTARIAAFDAAIKDEKEATEASIVSSSAAFAKEQIADKRIVPAQEKEAAALFAMAERADRELAEPVCFSADGKGETGKRTALVKQFFSHLPQHQFTEEQISDKTAFALGSTAPADKTDEQKEQDKTARTEKLLSKTTTGQAVLKEKK